MIVLNIFVGEGGLDLPPHLAATGFNEQMEDVFAVLNLSAYKEINSNISLQGNVDIICYMVMSLVSLQQGNVKKSEKSMKIVTTRAIAMKFSGKTWLMIILKVTKKEGFHSFSRKQIYGKNTGGVKLRFEI